MNNQTTYFLEFDLIYFFLLFNDLFGCLHILFPSQFVHLPVAFSIQSLLETQELPVSVILKFLLQVLEFLLM